MYDDAFAAHLPVGDAARARVVVTAGAGVAIGRAPLGAFVVLPRAARVALSLILEAIVALAGHLLAGTIDDVGRVGVAGYFQITVLTVLIWVLICHELILPWGLGLAAWGLGLGLRRCGYMLLVGLRSSCAVPAVSMS